MDPREANFDQWLDAQLRAVPVPDDLLPRLQQIPAADGHSLSAALRAVPIPAGLIERLLAIPLQDNDDLDAALRAVPMPAGFAWRLRRIPARNVQLRWASLALAASLLITVGLSYLSALGLYLVGTEAPQAIAQNPRMPEEPNILAPVPLPAPSPNAVVHDAPAIQRPAQPPVIDPPPKIDVPLATFGTPRISWPPRPGIFPKAGAGRCANRRPARLTRF